MTVGAIDLDDAIARATSAIDEAAILAVLDVLMSQPSPPGEERPLALAVSEWGRRTHPELAWEIDDLDSSSANVMARAASKGDVRAPELALYGHLDTSLTGSTERDSAITGETAPVARFAFDAARRTVRGFGVGVAKAPSAAGVVAFVRAAAALRSLGIAHRLTLLLAARGTHRAVPADGTARFGRGVEHALDRGWRPDAVLNVKGGAPGVLWEEPAAAYLRVRVRRLWGPALFRRQLLPDGGLARYTGAVADAIEEWRSDYLGAHGARGQLEPEVAIGAIRTGSPEKADILPGLLEIFIYAVLLPDDDPRAVALDLEAFLAPRVNALPGKPSVAVDLYAVGPGGVADPANALVRIAAETWARAGGDQATIRGWSGATDGGVFLSRGIPTVRLGPRVSRDETDPRIEIVPLDDLLSAARTYVEIALRYFAAAGVKRA